MYKPWPVVRPLDTATSKLIECGEELVKEIAVQAIEEALPTCQFATADTVRVGVARIEIVGMTKFAVVVPLAAPIEIYSFAPVPP